MPLTAVSRIACQPGVRSGPATGGSQLMPELPEVETMRRGILSIVGSRIDRFERLRCPLKRIQISPRLDIARRRVLGGEVTDVRRIGKRVAVVIESGTAIVFEPRMTGLVLIADPPDVDHLRVRLSLSGGPVSELLYWDRRGLGSVHVLTPEELDERYQETKLGPDALEIDLDTLRARLAESRRAIKVALLDQRCLAGVGNLYAAEILHLAGIHPEKACQRLSRSDWSNLHAAMREVLTEAIRYEGSTLADGTYRNALNRIGSYQNHHRVYGRAGQKCPRCGKGTINRIVQAQRATFFCPTCQRPPRRRKAATQS